MVLLLIPAAFVDCCSVLDIQSGTWHMDRKNPGTLPDRSKSGEKSIPGVKWHQWNKNQHGILRTKETPPDKKKLLRMRSF